MKLKKLLAAVTAAALAVTTMAVTSFTASAAAFTPYILLNVNSNDWGINGAWVAADKTEITASQTEYEFSYTAGKDDTWDGDQSKIEAYFYSPMDNLKNASIKSVSINGTDKNISQSAGSYNQYLWDNIENGTVPGYSAVVNPDAVKALGAVTNGDVIKIVLSVTLDESLKSIGAANFTCSKTAGELETGDSFTITYDSTNTPDTAKWVVKCAFDEDFADAGITNRWPQLVNSDGTVDNSASADTGLEVAKTAEGVYTFTAVNASKAGYAINVEASAAGDFSDTQYLGQGGGGKWSVAAAAKPTMTISPTTLTVAEGEDAVITITATNADGYTYEAESSDNAKVEASVDKTDGTKVIVKGVAAGTAEITVTGTKGTDIITAKCTVTVTEGATPPAVAVTVTPATAKIKVGETIKLTAAVTGKDDAVVTWEANKDQAGEVVVTVAADGTVTGKKAGAVEVWALVDGKRIDSNTSFCVVTVEADAPPAGTVGEWSENNGTFTYTHVSEGSNMDNKEIPIEKFELAESDKANAVEISAHVKVDGFWKVKLGINDTDGWKEAPAQEITDEGDIVLSINGIAADNLLIQTEWINGDTKVEVSDLKIKLADGTVKPYGGSTPNPPVDPTYTLTPATATVKIGLNNGQVFTLEGYTATEQIAWDIDSAYAAKYVGSDNGLENNQCKIVGIAVGGPVTLTAKSLDGDVLGTATITFTDSTTPDHTHTPANTWTSDATGHWHTCSGCSEKLDFAAHTSDNGTVTTPATETTAGTKTYKCTECGYVIKTETIPATGTGDKPTPPAPWVPHPGVSAPVVPTTGANNSSLPTVNGQNGWEAVSAEIITSSDGDKILVEMNSATKVPSTILGDLEGKDVDVVFNMGRGITWTVNGLSITSRKTIDFDISKNTRHIPDEVVDNAEGSHKKQISLDHKGTFGCTAALTYEVGTKYNGLYANLFYYNPKTEQLEFADCSLVSGGKAKFTFTHASDYLITISDEPLGEFEDVSSAAGIASDSSVIVNETAIGAVLAVIVLGFGIIVYRKRRHN